MGRAIAVTGARWWGKPEKLLPPAYRKNGRSGYIGALLRCAAAERATQQYTWALFSRLRQQATLQVLARRALKYFPAAGVLLVYPLRRFFSRFLLVALAGVLLFALVRFIAGAGEPGALVSFGTSLDPNELRHEAFEVDRTVRLAVHAVGSFEGEEALSV